MKTKTTFFRNLFYFLFAAALISGCGKNEQVQPLVYQNYSDPYNGFHFSFPQSWVLSADPGKVSIFSSQEAINKFYDPTENSEQGSMISVQVRAAGKTEDLNSFYAAVADSDKEIIPSYTSVTDVTIDGVPGKKLTYSIQLGNKLKLNGEKYLAVADSLEYIIDYKGFNDRFDTFKPVCDSLVKSFSFPVKKSAADINLPSQNFESFNNNFLEIGYPDNFDYTIAQAKGESLFSITFSGYRQDCTLQIDVLPAKGLSTDQAFDQNKVRYKTSSGSGQKNIAGLNFYYINYKLVANVNSRAYFAVKNDKLYRVTLNWYIPEEKDYLTVFEKMVNSIKLK